VIGIYIHEMGHVAALARYGIKASAPMFIPGLGAVVRMKQVLTDVRQDARVGLAGPIWGLGAGLAAYAIGRYTGSHSWFAIAQTTGFLNLFNLIPFWQLDGGRAFHALNRTQRFIAAVAIGLAWYQSDQGLLILLLILAAFQAFSKDAPEAPDHGTLVSFIFLIAALTWLSGITVVTG
jgi:Zn-dependent protease